MIKRMVQEGLGVTLWPQYTWREGMSQEKMDKVCLRPLNIPDFSRTVYMIRPTDVKYKEEVENFANFVIEYFKNIENKK